MAQPGSTRKQIAASNTTATVLVPPRIKRPPIVRAFPTVLTTIDFHQVTLKTDRNDDPDTSRGARFSTRVPDLDCTYQYYYNAQSIIEERDGSDNVLRQNVWGLMYIDELIQTSLNDDPDDLGEQDVETHYYTLHDTQFNIIALMTESGQVKERYEYTPHGHRQSYRSIGDNDDLCLSPFFLPERKWIGGATQPYSINPFGFQGLHHDESTGLIYNRARMLNPRLKRFNQRDPLGYPDGLNTYAAYHVMWGRVDPSGMGVFLPGPESMDLMDVRAGRPRRPKDEGVAKASPGMDYIVDVLLTTTPRLNYNFPKAKYVLGAFPPGWSVELGIEFGFEAKLCCYEDELGVQLSFSGSIELSGGFGTIIGDRENTEVTKSRDGRNIVRDKSKSKNQPPRSEYSGLRKWESLRDQLTPNGSQIDFGGLPTCKTDISGNMNAGVRGIGRFAKYKGVIDIEFAAWNFVEPVQFNYKPKMSWEKVGNWGFGGRVEAYGNAEFTASLAFIFSPFEIVESK